MFLTQLRKTAEAVSAMAIAVVFVVLAVVAVGVGWKIWDVLGGGHDGQKKPGGTISVGQQMPTTVTNKFAVRIGDGTQLVSIKADQNWDKHGWWPNIDFQSTNGTASVRDPDDHDQPASIKVGVQYCATGTLTRISQVDESGKAIDPASDQITFDMGGLFVCDVKWLPTADNEAAFHQDDTPDDFQGLFQERIKGAVLAATKAAPCPKRLDGYYTSQQYLDFAAGALAKQLAVPVERVKVLPGKQGMTSLEDQDSLRAGLDAFVKTAHLDINFFSGKGEAIDDSCYVDLGAVPLESLARNPPAGDPAGL